MDEHEDERYWFDDVVSQAVEEVSKSGDFPDAQNFHVKALMAKGSHPRGKEAASCILVSEKIRVATENEADFVLTFWEHDWQLMTPIQRLETIIHELHHIDHSDKTGNPKLRDHNDEFCSRAKHDKYSQELAKKIPMPAMLSKAPVQSVLP